VRNASDREARHANIAARQRESNIPHIPRNKVDDTADKKEASENK